MNAATLFIVFGATGDLMHRKLLPALYDLCHYPGTASPIVVLGAARSKIDDAAFRKTVLESLVARGVEDEKARQWATRNVYYAPIDSANPTDFESFRHRIESLEKEHGLSGNRVFYLSLPPAAFESTVTHLGEAGLASSEHGWTRIVVEKPFGRDLESARKLNEHIHRYFREDQVYRIDHYLGKETVQNLLIFRLGNAIFESLWNREHVRRVDILVAETVGVDGRAGYFDRVGTVRDMIQNHLTQLLTLIAMEPPAAADARSIRFEKIKVLQNVEPISPRDVILGQYAAGSLNGQQVPGYREEKGVPADSTTETYAALRLNVTNWRWQGVPFYLQTGKRLSRRLTRIAVTFRQPPIMLFRNDDRCRLASNVLYMTIQPDEGFSLTFEVKKPGEGYAVKTQQLRFDYAEAFGELPGAYRTLLEDVVIGDQTLFVHADEVEASWALFSPLLDSQFTVHPYPAGTWGPEESHKVLTLLPSELHA